MAKFFNCSRDILNDRESIEQMLRDGINRCALGLVSLDCRCYDPIGITAIAVISESHVAIHTYPETRHASPDIFTCSRERQSSLDLMDYFKEELAPGSTRIAEISRGNPIEIHSKNWITDDTNLGGFDIRYHIDKDIFSRVSKFQNISIIYDLTMHPGAFIDMDREIFLDNLFTKISASLNPSGMITAQCCSDYDEESLKVAEGILTKFFSDV
ncbi:MAG: adenosylmethionine decarboxylase, partial [Deltaproteobacteria bacterium]|nr:adenosylmethionine decarboxylase [Deltaproteobacteria bacterium]